jgi:diacylglycerol O-acyltransferase / wax synthase
MDNGEDDMTRQPFSNLDYMLLRMDNPVDPMIVTGVLVLGAPIDMEQLKATIETRLLRFDRFRQRVVPSRLPWRTPYWEDYPGLDLDYHVRRVTLPPPGDQAALQRTVSKLVGTPIDVTRPPWQVHLVEPYGPGCALICRIHHSLADGVALIHVLLSLADTEAGDSQSSTEQEYSQGGPDGIQSLQARTERPLVGRLMRRGLWILDQLQSSPELAQLGRDAVADVGDIVLSPPDTDSAFRGVAGVSKRIAWSEPVSLEEIKTIGRRLGGTVNDVLLTALAGALQRYLQARQGLPADVTFRAVMPINLRPAGDETELGNRISAVFLPLPVDIADPAERLAELKRRMDELKVSLQPTMVLAALEIVSRTPSTTLNLALNYLISKATVEVTNVRGPEERLYVAGAPLEEMMFWIPRYGGIGVGISILSYAGQVRLGVLSDKGIVPDPENIIAGFRDEFDALLALALEGKPPPSVMELSALLDDALATLDELVPNSVEQHAPE